MIGEVQSTQAAAQYALVLLTVTAAAADWYSRRIPNWLIIAGFVCGFGLNALLGGWRGLVAALLGFGLALLIYVPLYLLRAMGGGDVKLMAAVGCLAGPQNWFTIFLFTSVLGGVLALILLLMRNAAGGALWNIGRILKELVRLRLPFRSHPHLDIGHARALSLPHGIPILAGTLFFLYSLHA